MSDPSTIDPDILRFVEQMREDWKAFPPFEELSFPDKRVAAEKVREPWVRGGPAMAHSQEHRLDFGGGELRVRIHRPTDAPGLQPALIYLHGGGFTLFSIDTHDRLMREYAARGGFTVIGVDYPLAPETKFPVALDRIEALVLWLQDHGADWQVDASRLAIGGDSAGGNLSFATVMRLRDRDRQELIKCILSNYGGFAPSISDEAERRFGGPGSIMDREEALGYWKNYLRDESDMTDPYAAPLHADLNGFPPVFLVIPDLDIVAENSFNMDARLKAAGVAVECAVYPGAVHSFLEAVSISAIAQGAIQDGADFVARHICELSGPTA